MKNYLIKILSQKKNLLRIKSIDLHGYTLDQANKFIESFIIKSYEKNINKLIVVTGKGLHSQNEKDPYVSKELSILKYSVPEFISKNKVTLDENDQKEFLKGAKIAYETIITDFSDNDNKITTSKPLLNNEIYNQFNEALKERSARGHYAEITFIGINSAIIKEHKKLGKILNVTVEFIAEVITCIKDKDKKIISGDPEKIKKIYDTWVFSRDTTSVNPNWQLVNTLT